MYSLVRMDKASIVQVIFLSAWDTNGPPSTQNRFLHSWDWLHLLSGAFLGSLPILTVPASWMILPGAWSPQLLCGPSSWPHTCTAPMASSISAKVFFICLAWLISYSE